MIPEDGEKLVPLHKLAPEQFERAVSRIQVEFVNAGVDVTRDMVVLALCRAFTKRWAMGQGRFSDIRRSARSFLDANATQEIGGALIRAMKDREA